MPDEYITQIQISKPEQNRSKTYFSQTLKDEGSWVTEHQVCEFIKSSQKGMTIIEPGTRMNPQIYECQRRPAQSIEESQYSFYQDEISEINRDPSIFTIDHVDKDAFSLSPTQQQQKQEREQQFLIRWLYQSIMDKDQKTFERIVADINEKQFFEIFNFQDQFGRTPLMLATKKCVNDFIYYSMIKTLLLNGKNKENAIINKQFSNIFFISISTDADPQIADIQKWNCLEEAIFQGDIMLVTLFLDNMIRRKKEKIRHQQRELDNILSEIPDFYLEMQWQFTSSVIPLFSKMAPSDTFKITQFGRSLRCDNSVFEIKNLKSFKRDMSLIYNPTNLNELSVQNRDYKYLLKLFRETKQYYMPLEEIDVEQKSKIVSDLLTSESVEGKIDINSCEMIESKAFLGGQVKTQIENVECQKFQMKLDFNYTVFKKKHGSQKEHQSNGQNNETMGTRKGSIEPERPAPLSTQNRELVYPIHNSQKHNTQLNNNKLNDHRRQFQFSEEMIAKNLEYKSNDNQFISGEIDFDQLDQDADEQYSREDFQETKHKSKKNTLGLWIASDYQFKLQYLLPILEFLANGNATIQPLCDILNQQQIRKFLIDQGFPIKIQIPFSYSISSTIQFQNFEWIKTDDEEIIRKFKVPTDFKCIPRKIAQKTMENERRRIHLANIFI